MPEFLRTADDWKKDDDPVDTQTKERADQLTEQDYENAVGLREFQTAMQHASEKNFDEAAFHLKEGLKTLKQRNQERSSSYVTLMKNLAHVSFQAGKYTEAEKYFKVTVRVTELLTKNPQSIFAA